MPSEPLELSLDTVSALCNKYTNPLRAIEAYRQVLEQMPASPVRDTHVADFTLHCLVFAARAYEQSGRDGARDYYQRILSTYATLYAVHVPPLVVSTVETAVGADTLTATSSYAVGIETDLSQQESYTGLASPWALEESTTDPRDLPHPLSALFALVLYNGACVELAARKDAAYGLHLLRLALDITTPLVLAEEAELEAGVLAAAAAVEEASATPAAAAAEVETTAAGVDGDAATPQPDAKPEGEGAENEEDGKGTTTTVAAAAPTVSSLAQCLTTLHRLHAALLALLQGQVEEAEDGLQPLVQSLEATAEAAGSGGGGAVAAAAAPLCGVARALLAVTEAQRDGEAAVASHTRARQWFRQAAQGLPALSAALGEHAEARKERERRAGRCDEWVDAEATRAQQLQTYVETERAALIARAVSEVAAAEASAGGSGRGRRRSSQGARASLGSTASSRTSGVGLRKGRGGGGGGAALTGPTAARRRTAAAIAAARLEEAAQAPIPSPPVGGGVWRYTQRRGLRARLLWLWLPTAAALWAECCHGGGATGDALFRAPLAPPTALQPQMMHARAMAGGCGAAGALLLEETPLDLALEVRQHREQQQQQQQQQTPGPRRHRGGRSSSGGGSTLAVQRSVWRPPPPPVAEYLLPSPVSAHGGGGGGTSFKPQRRGRSRTGERSLRPSSRSRPASRRTGAVSSAPPPLPTAAAAAANATADGTATSSSLRLFGADKSRRPPPALLKLLQPPSDAPAGSAARGRKDVEATVALLSQRLTTLLRLERVEEERRRAADVLRSGLAAYYIPQVLLAWKAEQLAARAQRALVLDRSARILVRFFRLVVREQPRRYNFMSRPQRRAAARQAAAVTLQRYTRRWLAQREVAALRAARERRRRAIVVVQSLQRRRLAQQALAAAREAQAARTTAHRAHMARVFGAVQLQRLYRGHATRLALWRAQGQHRRAMLHHLHDSRHYHATQIQRVVRGFLVRRQPLGRAVHYGRCRGRNRYRAAQMNEGSRVIQRCFRQYLARRRAAAAAAETAVLCVQRGAPSLARSYLRRASQDGGRHASPLPPSADAVAAERLCGLYKMRKAKQELNALRAARAAEKAADAAAPLPPLVIKTCIF